MTESYCHRTDGACTGQSCWVCTDEPDLCPDCTTTTECPACLGDRTGHEAADMRLEELDR